MAKLPVQKLKASKSKPVPVRIVSEASSPSTDKGYEDRERKYRAEDALRTIKEYEKLQSDKSLMKDVKALAKEQMNALKKIC
jgi:hypothetical protein